MQHLTQSLYSILGAKLLLCGPFMTSLMKCLSEFSLNDDHLCDYSIANS